MDLVDLNGMWPSLKDIGEGIISASGSVKQCFYGSYKNIFAHANEEECPQKRGDKEWRTGALLLSQ